MLIFSPNAGSGQGFPIFIITLPIAYMLLYQMLSDHELLDLIAEGKEHAFNELFNRYWDKLLQTAVHKVEDVMEAENIVQDVFVSLWKRRKDLQIKGSFSHYLLVSVKYRVIKTLNRQRTQRLYLEGEHAYTDLLDDSTQQYLDFMELRQRLEKLIGDLPEKARLIYRMNKDEGMSYREIAEELNITEKAVDAHLVRTKKILRSGLYHFLLLNLFELCF